MSSKLKNQISTKNDCSTSEHLNSKVTNDLKQSKELTTIPERVCFQVCMNDRDQSNMKYIYVLDDDTILHLKEKIHRKLFPLKSTNFSLTIFDEKKCCWNNIDNIKNDETINNSKFSSDTILNVEWRVKIDINRQHTSKPNDLELKLKLCTRPFDKKDYIDFTIPSSTTIGQLKEKARERVFNQNTNNFHVWTNDGWIELETAVDHLTLVGYDQCSFISFGSNYDFIPGVCGLRNLGGTCFMNSALQCLSNIPQFTQKILSFDDKIDAPIIGEYSKLIKTIWSGKHTCTVPSSLLVNIRENLQRYSKYRQQDAQEFMNYFIHLIHQEFTNDKSLITDLFYGRIRSTVKCQGGCDFTDDNEEEFSFLPLPIENDIKKYNILYLQSNCEQSIKSVSSNCKTIDKLIESFIQQNKLELSSERIQAVKIVDNRIINTYPSDTFLNDRTAHQLTFIELPTKNVDQKYIQLEFSNHQTYKRFRPPIFLVCSSYGCFYDDLSKQINQIQNHLYSATRAPTSAYHFYWIDYFDKFHPMEPEIHGENILSLIKQINIEIDSELVENYTNQYNIRSSLNNISLNNLLLDFFSEELLNGNYYCSRCSDLKKAKQKSDLILPLPNVLIIQLKRFTHEAHSDEKIDTYIDFPLTDLDLSQYVIKEDKMNIREPILYDLVAVSNHMGTLRSGHYTTYAKNYRNNKWYSFNDEHTREIRNENDIVTKDAYILVYVKRTD